MQGKAGRTVGYPFHDQDLEEELMPSSRGSTGGIVKRDLKRGSMPLLFLSEDDEGQQTRLEGRGTRSDKGSFGQMSRN